MSVAACASSCLDAFPLGSIRLEQPVDPFRGRMYVESIWMGLGNRIVSCAPDLECPTHIGADVVCSSSRVKRAPLVIVSGEGAIVTRLFIGNASARQWLGTKNGSRSQRRAPHNSSGQAPSSGRQRQTGLDFSCLASRAFLEEEIEREIVSGWIEEEWRAVHGSKSSEATLSDASFLLPVKRHVIFFRSPTVIFRYLCVCVCFKMLAAWFDRAQVVGLTSTQLGRSPKAFLAVARRDQQNASEDQISI